MKYKTQRITLRIPAELHQKLTEEADKSCKSMNAEILARIQNSFESLNSLDETRLEKLIRLTIKEELSKNK